MREKATKVDVLYLVTSLNWTPIFEWHVVKCGSNNKYKKDMCLKDTRLHAQNTQTILGSTLLGGGYMTTY